jgi:hypothetical protein
MNHRGARSAVTDVVGRTDRAWVAREFDVDARPFADETG